jgi:hypothetical protein
MSDAISPLPTQRSRLTLPLWRFFRVPPPRDRVRFWHVSPAIDMAAYHFSWMWILLPLVLAGPNYPDDYVPLYVAVLTFGFIHRHYTLGYVYLDPEIFARHRGRFVWVPLLLGAGLLSTPYLLYGSIPSDWLAIGDFSWPSADFRLKIIVTTIIFGAGLWNIWHTLSQKYGILRIYTAKAREENETSVPGWVDRLFVMGWLPLIVTFVAPRFSEEILHEFRVTRTFLHPIMEWLHAAQPIAVPLATAVAIASLVIFFAFEWRVHRLRNRPRLSMAIGMASLWFCFVLFDPIKVYLAFAFSHGLEYMVFVWAFQRRRYAEVRSPQPLIARLLEHPWITYPLYTLALGGLYILFSNWQGHDIWQVPNRQVGGMKIGKWVFYWGVFQSLLHFYYDGFLWKTRQAAVRTSL